MKRLLVITLLTMTCLYGYSKPVAPDSVRVNLFQAIETAIDSHDPSVYHLLDDFTTRYGITADALTLQGLMNYSEGDAEAGFASLQKALESITDVDLLDRSTILLVIAGKTDDFLQSLDYVNAAISANTKNPKAYAARSKLYLGTGFMVKEAESDTKKAIKYSGGNPTYRALLCRIHIIQDKHKQALKEANALIKEFPDYSQPYFLRAYIMRHQDKLNNYVDDYLVYLQLTHDYDITPLFEVAETHYDYIMEFAGQILKKAMSRENIAYWNYFIEGMKGYVNDPTAIQNLNTALQYAEDPDLICRLYISKSGHYLKQNQYDSALVMVQMVIDTVEMNGGLASYWLYHNKALFLRQLKRYAEADTAFTVCLARNIEDSTERSDIYHLRSSLRFDHLRDTLSALADLDSALVYTPHSCPVLYAHARLCGLLGRLDQATTDYDLILHIDTVVAPNSYRHFALAKLGRRAEAEQWLAQVIERNDNKNLKPSILYNAACMYSLLGDSKMAIKYLMDSMALEPIDCDLIRNDEDFANIRQTAEFISILKVACSE